MKRVVSYGWMLIAALAMCLVPGEAMADAAVYRLTLALRVPRVYDNTQSLGYRKMQSQKIVGYLGIFMDNDDEYAREPRILACQFINHTHKVAGQRVTYGDIEPGKVMWRYIGNNRTRVFRNTLIRLEIDLNPSYNIGADEPDNTLIVTLSGYGTTDKAIRGYVTGQMGCGCMAYGHVSPTRTAYGEVDDIAPTFGHFTMKRVNRALSCSL